MSSADPSNGNILPSKYSPSQIFEAKMELLSVLLEAIEPGLLPALRDRLMKAHPGSDEHEAIIELVEGEMALRQIESA